jgi:hypothetical protein
MARLAKTLVTQREEEVTDAFLKGASVKEANEALFLKHQKRMGLKRIYEIRDAVRAALASKPDEAVRAPVVEPETVASTSADGAT